MGCRERYRKTVRKLLFRMLLKHRERGTMLRQRARDTGRYLNTKPKPNGYMV